MFNIIRPEWNEIVEFSLNFLDEAYFHTTLSIVYYLKASVPCLSIRTTCLVRSTNVVFAKTRFFPIVLAQGQT